MRVRISHCVSIEAHIGDKWSGTERCLVGAVSVVLLHLLMVVLRAGMVQACCRVVSTILVWLVFSIWGVVELVVDGLSSRTGRIKNNSVSSF